MAANLNVNIGANVNEAVQGLTQVAQRTKYLQDSIAVFRSKLADTKSEKFYAFALDNIAKKQSELNRIQKVTGEALNKTSANSNKATQSLTDLSRIAQDAPYGFIGIANNINPLVESFGRLKASTGSTGGALKSLVAGLAGPGGIGLAVGVVSSLLVTFGDKLFGAGKAAEKTKSDADKLKDSINGIFGEVAKEASQVASFVAVLKSETETRQRKLQAIKELQQIQPDIFRGLKLEGDQVVGLTSSYNTYVESLKTVVAAKIKQAQLDQVIEKLLKAQGVTLTDQEQAIITFGNEVSKAYGKQIAGSVAGSQYAERQKKQTQAQTNEIKNLNAEVERLTKDLSQLSNGVKLDPIKAPKTKTTKEDDVVARAKRIAAELAKIGAVVPEFTVFQTEKEQKDIAKKFLKDFEGGKIPLRFTLDIKEEDVEFPEGYKKQIYKTGEYGGEIFNDGYARGLENSISEVNVAFRKIDDATEKKIKQQGEKNRIIYEQVVSLSGSAFNDLFDALRNGENAFKAFGNSVKETLFSVVQQILTTAATAAILSFIFPAGLGGVKGFGGFFNNLLGFADGGKPPVGRPSIVGERGPELFIPDVSGTIIPNNRMSSFSGRPAFASSMGGRSVVRGNDILLASARTQRSQNRVNA